MIFSTRSLLLPALTAALFTAGVRSSQAAAFLIDFGGGNTTTNGAAPDDPANFWNNVDVAIGTSATGQLPNMVTTTNGATGVGLAIVSPFNGVNENGAQNSTVYPIDATRDSLFGNTEAFGTGSNFFPAFKITGLDPALSYNFNFYASRTGVTDNRETGYTLTGANNGFTALNAANNIDGIATANGILPTAAGEITINIAPTANNNNGNHFTYLGALRVESAPIPEPSGALLAAGGLLLLARRRNRG